MPITPIGAMKMGLGSLSPNSSIERSRTAQSTIIRGVSPQAANASALRRWVDSSPHPPRT